MIPTQNYEVAASVLFFIVSKIVSFLVEHRRIRMHNQRLPTLTSIPEKAEIVEETVPQKWVPKKKHEVLKAKYKCLKKLFQVYDASVIGILPEPYSGQGDGLYNEDEAASAPSRRKKKSNRIKHDVSAGTSEVSVGASVSVDQESRASESVSPIKVQSKSTVETITDSNISLREGKYASTQGFYTNDSSICEEKECDCSVVKPLQLIRYPADRKRPTRFQCFLQRIFGIRRERPYNDYCFNPNHIYALSDINIDKYGRCGDKRRRRGFRFRRLRKLRKNQSEIALRDVGSPAILSYVQSVQRNCLCDTTPRQCPIIGCRMICYGIINYNDHLNLCHFPERKHVCHYCHEGFEKELDKFVHENEHIGISKLHSTLSATISSDQYRRSEMVTQTEPDSPKGTGTGSIQEDKLKKIMSFFDKIANSDHLMSEVKKNRFSYSNLAKASNPSEGDDSSGEEMRQDAGLMKAERDQCQFAGSESTLACSNSSQVKCHFCGEKFNFRRQLSLHVDLEHRVHDKYSKFHSCTGIMNQRPKTLGYIAEDGQLTVESVSNRSSIFQNLQDTASSIAETCSEVTEKKQETVVNCDPSTNMLYCNSKDLLNQTQSKTNNLIDKIKCQFHYKWEPGSKIINI